jgi:hypothetical protein
MDRRQPLFAQHQCPLQQRLGLREAALLEVQDAEVVETLADIWLVGRQCIFTQRERAPEQRLSVELSDISTCETDIAA